MDSSLDLGAGVDDAVAQKALNAATSRHVLRNAVDREPCFVALKEGVVCIVYQLL
jgi:hypothetical protein